MLRARIATTVLAAAAASALLAVSAGAASASPAPPRTVAAGTFITDRPDSGNGGYWADDSFLRVITITRTGGTAGAYTYTAHLTDEGGFTTIKGAPAPNQGGPYAGDVITASVSGVMNGSADFTFTASTLPSPALVPGSENDRGLVPADSTSAWYELAFPAGTVFGGPGIGNWSWSYYTPKAAQYWIDAAYNGYGDLAGDGQITG